MLGAAIELALRERRLALRLALFAGGASGATFLAADIVHDLLGRRVGSPNAAATCIMISVMLAGNILASMAGSGVVGILLSWYTNRKTTD